MHQGEWTDFDFSLVVGLSGSGKKSFFVKSVYENVEHLYDCMKDK